MAGLHLGVSVEQVLALAPHVTLDTETPAPAPTNGVWAKNPSEDRKTTAENVQQFIEDVANQAEGRLLRRLYIKDPEAREIVEASARGIIAVGAAATLISAVFPAKAGINDQTSYSAELWARFNTQLDRLVEDVNTLLEDQKNPETGGEAPAPISGLIGSMFRESAIKDEPKW